MEEPGYKILVVSSCTGAKRYNPSDMPGLEDFQTGRIKEKEKELDRYKCPAVEMYTGAQHLKLMKGIGLLRERYGDGYISLRILSAGYGFLKERTSIVPYEATFSQMKAAEIDRWAEKLSLKKELEQAIQGYDIIFFLLGSDYLRALKLPIHTEDEQTLFFLTSGSGACFIPDLDNYHIVETGKREAQSYKCGLFSLKGHLFKLFCEELMEHPWILNKIVKDPCFFMYPLQKYRQDNMESQQNLFEDYTPITYQEYLEDLCSTRRDWKRKFAGFHVKPHRYAANYRAGKSIRFFIPEWDDRVDPEYDFLTDRHNRNGLVPYQHDIYAHNIFPQPCYDGILVSLTTLGEKKFAAIKEMGIQHFLKLNDKIPLMADCGAFNYIDKEVPPFDTKQVIEYYQGLGFDYGVSIDHLIVGDYEKDPQIRKQRHRLTQENAEEFLKRYRAGNYNFQPIGVAQGWNPQSYYESVKLLVELGYENIALGSLIPKKSSQIYDILKAVAPIIPEYMEVHLFGVARSEGIKAFHQLGTTSFDSAGPLRRAWLGAGHNYFTLEKKPQGDPYTGDIYKKYTAIRIPFISPSYLPDSLVKELYYLEGQALRSIRAYGQGSLSCERALESIINYEWQHRKANVIRSRNKYLREGTPITEEREKDLQKKEKEVDKVIDKHKHLYLEVLESRPWERCDCTICRNIGVEVIIFRGNNRNRRRGFHNTYIFNRQFRLAVKDETSME